MARIQEYNSQIAANTEVQGKQMSGVSAGSGVENLFQGAGQLAQHTLDFNAKFQAAKVDTQISKNNLDFETQIATQKASFDPTQPDARENFMKGYDQANQKALDSISDPRAREYAEKKIADHKAQYWNMALHNNAKLQGQEKGALLDERVNNDNQAISLNPALLQMKIDGLQDLHTTYGGAYASDADINKARLDLAKKYTETAVTARINDPNESPERVIKDVEAGKYDLGDKTNSFIEKARSEIRARDNQQKSNETKAQTTQNQTWAQNHRELHKQVDDGNLDFMGIHKAVDQNVVSPEQGANLEGRLKARIKGTLVDDSGMVMDAQHRLSLPEGDKNKITDFQTLASEYGHGIGQKSLARLANTYLSPPGAGQDVSQGMSQLSKVAAKTLIQPNAIPWGDRQGMSLWAKSLNEIHDTYQENIKSGKVTSQEMFDPTNKNYLGKIIDKYQRSRSEMSAQATYVLHGPGKSDLNIGSQKEPPIGSDPNKTPVSANSSPAFTAKEQAAIDALVSKIPASKGGK